MHARSKTERPSLVLTAGNLREARMLLNGMTTNGRTWPEEEVDVLALMVAAERKLCHYYA